MGYDKSSNVAMYIRLLELMCLVGIDLELLILIRLEIVKSLAVKRERDTLRLL